MRIDMIDHERVCSRLALRRIRRRLPTRHHGAPMIRPALYRRDRPSSSVGRESGFTERAAHPDRAHRSEAAGSLFSPAGSFCSKNEVWFVDEVPARILPQDPHRFGIHLKDHRVARAYAYPVRSLCVGRQLHVGAPHLTEAMSLKELGVGQVVADGALLVFLPVASAPCPRGSGRAADALVRASPAPVWSWSSLSWSWC